MLAGRDAVAAEYRPEADTRVECHRWMVTGVLPVSELSIHQ